VRQEIEHVREGEHGRSTKQVIPIGLSKARRAGVKLPPPNASRTYTETQRKAQRDIAKAGKKIKPSQARSRGQNSTET
jgi:uncharacterized protein DUF6496